MKHRGTMIKTVLKAPKGRKGDLDFESYSERKRSNPSPEEKRHDTGETDYRRKRVIKHGKPTDKGGQEYAVEEHSRSGNTQKSKHKRKVTVKSKREKGELRSSSDHTVVESGGKYKDKLGGMTSKRHYVKGGTKMSSKRTIRTGKNKQKKYKGKSASEFRVPKVGLLQKRGLA